MLVSLERIQGFLDIEHEPEPSKEGEAPAYWPASGTLEVQNLSARYSRDGPRVLHDLSFKIHSGERIGVVGRTGSGKVNRRLRIRNSALNHLAELIDAVSPPMFVHRRPGDLRWNPDF